MTALEIADRLLDLGDPTAASALADRLAADSRVTYLADYLRGRVELAAGNWPSALAHFRGAMAELTRLPAYHLKARLGVGQCYALAGNPDQQLAAFEIAGQLSPGRSRPGSVWPTRRPNSGGRPPRSTSTAD